MSSSFIRVEFCPNYHSTVPFPRNDPPQTRTLPVDIQKCQNPSDVRKPISDAMRRFRPDIDFRMDYKAVALMFHRFDQSCYNGDSLSLEELKSARYKCVGNEKWDSSDANKVIRVHILNGKKGPEPWARPGFMSDDSDDEMEKTNKKGPRSTQKTRGYGDSGNKSGGGVDGERSNGEDGKGQDNDLQPQYLFVRTCDKRHNENPLLLRDSWVRLGRGYCRNLDDIGAALAQKLIAKRPNFAYDRQKHRVKIHKALDLRCASELTFESLLEHYTTSTTTPDLYRPSVANKVVRIHFEGTPELLIGQTLGSTTNAAAASQKQKDGRPKSKQTRDKNATSSEQRKKQGGSRGGEHDDQQHSQNESPNPGDLQSGPGREENDGRRYMILSICRKFHPDGVVKLQANFLYMYIKLDPPFGLFGLPDVEKVVRKRTTGLDGSRRHTLKIHPREPLRCDMQLTMQQIIDGFLHKSKRTIDSPEFRRKILAVHFEEITELENDAYQSISDEFESQSEKSATGNQQTTLQQNVEENDNEPPLRRSGPARTTRRTSKKRKRTGTPWSRSTRKRAVSPVIERVENAQSASEEENNGELIDEDYDDQVESHESDEEDDHDDTSLHRLPYEELDGRRRIRVGKLWTEEEFRRPVDRTALPMRRVVVALVSEKGGAPKVEFQAIDSWTIMQFRVGDYPSGDPWKDDGKGPEFIPDEYWRRAYERKGLEKAVIEYWRTGPKEEVHLDKDSDLDQPVRRPQAKGDKRPRTKPEKPEEPLMAPLRPIHTSRSIQGDFRSDFGGAKIPDGQRIEAVVCFANALGDKGSYLKTYRNFQISLPRNQTREDFRAFIRNVKIHDKGWSLKHILRKWTFGFWGDFQVWVMPVFSDNAIHEDAYCWDYPKHAKLEMCDFVHAGNYKRRQLKAQSNAQVFIEIRIVPDPRYQRKERAWSRHKGYREGRTPWYGWKKKEKRNGHCILDDEEDKGQMRRDEMGNTLPPSNP